MIGVIIAGHGNFGSGINSVIELIAGKQDKVEVVDFVEGDSTEDLKDKLKGKIAKLSTQGYIVFTDIPGGSPFNVAVEMFMDRENCEVLSGTNVPMILEILFDRDNSNAKDLKDRAIETGKNQVLSFGDRRKKSKSVDGI